MIRDEDIDPTCPYCREDRRSYNHPSDPPGYLCGSYWDSEISMQRTAACRIGERLIDIHDELRAMRDA